MRVLHIVFTKNWSWGFSGQVLEENLNYPVDTTISNREIIRDTGYDVILSQQITLMRYIMEKGKTVCRLGGNYTFENNTKTVFDNELRQVFAVIATNKKLYNISKRVNPNTFLVPNGLDLTGWNILKEPPDVFTVGFCANISSQFYRDYKGYDLVKLVCEKLNTPLKTALYGKGQIPHKQMVSDFYSKISVLLHPTKGEGCSNTIMEALACGIPVITTKLAGFHGEMLEDGVNVLFCERTTESIERCIKRLKEDRELYEKLKINGRKFAEKYHNIKDVAKAYDTIFNACYQFNKLKKNKGETMRLRYTGSKPQKIVIYGNKQYVFTPECDVDDDDVIKFLLAPERKGLFIASRTIPTIRVEIPDVFNKILKDEKKATPKEPTQQKKNIFKCPECSFTSTSRIGVISHQRNKHKRSEK